MIDPLSEVLRSVRLSGGIFLDARFSAPWSVHTQILAEDCGSFAVKPALLIAYHFVIEGKLLLSTAGEPTIELIRSGAETGRAARCDLVVAVGGGSAIDAGKAAGAETVGLMTIFCLMRICLER